MKSLFAGILLLVVAANAERPCEIPTQFVGNFKSIDYNVDAGMPVGGGEGKMYYDGDNKRMRIEGQHDGKEYTVILLYQEGKQYVIGTGYCYVMPVKGTFHSISIPATASLVNGGRIGTASNGLYVNRYFGEQDGGKGIVTVTQQGCVISSFVGLSKHNGTNHITYFSLTDVSLSYDDHVFDKPAGCHSIPGARRRRSVGRDFWENLKEVIDSV